ncbi:ScaI family restriction endonuclease [Trichormus azollae]|uniref:ScaI family restriction endonuclease n=1 Tax=Trichormus azollae TaxID=1164 RepID=UPI00325CE181
MRDVALVSWNLLWQTKIGEGDTSLSLAEIDPPAIVVGSFFKKSFVKELERRYEEQWRGTQNKDDKNIVCLVADKY